MEKKTEQQPETLKDEALDKTAGGTFAAAPTPPSEKGQKTAGYDLKVARRL